MGVLRRYEPGSSLPLTCYKKKEDETTGTSLHKVTRWEGATIVRVDRIY